VGRSAHQGNDMVLLFRRRRILGHARKRRQAEYGNN
jgi:hypothetical protein